MMITGVGGVGGGEADEVDEASRESIVIDMTALCSWHPLARATAQMGEVTR